MYPGHASYADVYAPTVPIRRGRRRPSALLHTIVVVAAWMIAAVVTLAVMAETKIGPVVYRVTQNHGFHLGDVYTILIMSAFAGVVTLGAVVHFAIRSRRR